MRVNANANVKLLNVSGVFPDVTDSDSEFSSESKKEDIYARVNRRPTPHKKRHKPRYSDGSLPPPPIPPYTEDRHLLVQQDQLEKGRYSPLG